MAAVVLRPLEADILAAGTGLFRFFFAFTAAAAGFPRLGLSRIGCIRSHGIFSFGFLCALSGAADAEPAFECATRRVIASGEFHAVWAIRRIDREKIPVDRQAVFTGNDVTSKRNV